MLVMKARIRAPITNICSVAPLGENHYFPDLPKRDSGGAIELFGDIHETKLEIRSRFGMGASRLRERRFYSQSKWSHSSGAQAAIGAEVLGT